MRQTLAFLADWAKRVQAELQPLAIYAFGSLIYRGGEQFGDKSDVDLVVVMPEIPDAVDRADWLASLLPHKLALEDALGKILKRTDRSEVLSSVVIATPIEISMDVHKGGTAEFFSRNRFLDLLTSEIRDGLPGAGALKLAENLVGECLRFVQYTRNIYVAVNSLGDPGLRDFDDPTDAAPKPTMRHAAMIDHLEDEGDAEPGAEFDLDIGADRLTIILHDRRKLLGDLVPAYAARRSGRGERRPLSAKEQVVLAELIYDAAIQAEARASAAAAAPARPTTGGAHSTVVFATRFGDSFPGVRGVQWFDDQEDIRQRLRRLLAEPLEFDDSTPIWWSRGPSNLHISHYMEEVDRVLINDFEMRIRRVAAVNPASYKYEFLYVEVEPLPPTGLYPTTQAQIDEVDRGQGPFAYYWEEYGVVDGKHLITRAEADDGSAMIDGKLQSLDRRLRVVGRYVTKYNFVIAAAGSPILDMDYDYTLEGHLNAMLKGEDRLEAIAKDSLKLPTGRF